MTSPPWPPSPPSGPPRGTYFSRRKLTQPRPPSPARTSICTRSMKLAISGRDLSASGERAHERLETAAQLPLRQRVGQPHACVVVESGARHEGDAVRLEQVVGQLLGRLE